MISWIVQYPCKKMIAVVVMATIIVGVCCGDPPGHLKPLGEHSKPVGGPMLMGKFPSPWLFHKEFVRPSKPLIMRKVLENGDIPAYKKWTDEYLSDIFGHLEMDIEKGKKENRVDGSMKTMSLKQYIAKYNKMDGYLVTDIPKQMKGDINVPLTLQCGGFQSRITNVIMWFSSGGTKSHLHNDGLDNINCLFDGRKDFFMVDKKHKDLIEADGWKVDGALSYVDVEKVDMYKFPKLQKVPWHKVTMNKGDCLFIPQGWYHHVDSAKGRNLALNFWFAHLLWHNMTDCEEMDAHKAPPVPLSKFNMISADEDVEGFRNDMFQSFEKADKEFVKREDFLLTANSDDDKTLSVFNKCFDVIDKNKDNKLTWDEIQTFDMMKMFNDYKEFLFPELGGGKSDDRDEENDEDDEVGGEQDDDIADEEKGTERSEEEKGVEDDVVKPPEDVKDEDDKIPIIDKEEVTTEGTKQKASEGTKRKIPEHEEL